MIAEYDRLSEVRSALLAHIEDGTCGLFFSRNIAGDEMVTIYQDGEICVDFCYGYSYFEVFGLTDEEQHSLTKYYELIRNEENERRQREWEN